MTETALRTGSQRAVTDSRNLQSAMDDADTVARDSEAPNQVVTQLAAGRDQAAAPSLADAKSRPGRQELLDALDVRNLPPLGELEHRGCHVRLEGVEEDRPRRALVAPEAVEGPTRAPRTSTAPGRRRRRARRGTAPSRRRRSPARPRPGVRVARRRRGASRPGPGSRSGRRSGRRGARAHSWAIRRGPVALVNRRILSEPRVRDEAAGRQDANVLPRTWIRLTTRVATGSPVDWQDLAGRIYWLGLGTGKTDDGPPIRRISHDPESVHADVRAARG